MLQHAEQLALTLSVSLIPVGILLVAMHATMLNRMRSAHSTVWESLGRPRLLFAKTSGETISTLKFLWRRDYLGSADENFTTLCGRVRTVHAAFLTLLVAAIVLYAVVACRHLGFGT